MRYPVGNTGSKEEFEKDWYIAQGFGVQTSYGFHEGADINLKTGGDTDLGQEIKAIADGRITYYHFSSHPTTGFGRHLVYKINGAWGSRWVHCCHLTDQDFKGSVQDVTKGQIIGRLGKSGTPYAHLHFAIFKVDPVAFGIDNIANTTNELNQYWEDPIAFINTWMTQPVSTPSIVTDQSKYDFGNGFGIMELQAARSIMQAQKSEIENKKQKLVDGATFLQELANRFES
jgi:murein DD-endopeptidase MepM/ murein hydrolase activator NlpD